MDEGRLTVLDGAMGTELVRMGVPLHGRAWTANALLSRPEAVALVHRRYVDAGATVHTACTFRTQRRVVGEPWEALARSAMRIARASAGAGHRIAASMAPLEDCYRPDRSPGRAGREEHRELARVLASEGADILLCETFPAAEEAVVAVEEAVRTNVETWVAFTAGPRGSLMTPRAMGDAARSCALAGASAVLVNCTAASLTRPFVDALATAGVRVGAYANAGAEDEGVGWGANPSSAAEAYAAFASRWIEAGATIVGGCCGTRPEHVARIALMADQRAGTTSTRP